MENNFIIIFTGKYTFQRMFSPAEKTSLALTAHHCIKITQFFLGGKITKLSC